MGAPQHVPVERTSVHSRSSDEFFLKLLIVALFLPEGLSFFIGEFRLSVARVLLMLLSTRAVVRFFRLKRAGSTVHVPSDSMVLAASAWMVLAAVITDGMLGLKSSVITVIEWAGAYYAFRYLLPPSEGSVRIVKFCCAVMIVVVGVAMLDALSGKPFTYELVKGLTGYAKPPFEMALAVQSETLFRNGTIRAMGPLEHSILFGAVCAWFGALAVFTFPSRLFGWVAPIIGFVGIWFSQAKGPLLGLVIALGLAVFYVLTKRFPSRWRVLGLAVAAVLTMVFCFSGSPVATLMRLGGMSPEAAWYREAIWETATPLVLHSPLFGIGVGDDWDWQGNGALIGISVDAFWLRVAMMFGIPGAALILLTMVSAFWGGPVDKSPFLSPSERRLSVALGLVTTVIVFLGFTVHYWGTCWILVGIFPAIRANIAEAAILRERMADSFEAAGMRNMTRADPRLTQQRFIASVRRRGP
jgi:O-antigen ligase